ncbi:MAG: 50S ribosomal protein L24 [Nitrospinae bacterium]|nr:50S ribosomal protein L24 [Nitrospinota bacterium]
MNVKKDDFVEVQVGRDKGKRGKVLSVLPKAAFVIIEKVNMVKRHTRPTQKIKQGGIVEKEGKVRANNVMVVCPKCDKAVRLGGKRLESGKNVRTCKKCGEVLDIVS